MASNSTTITIFLLTLTIVNTFCKAVDVLWSSDRNNPTLEAGSSLAYGKYILKMQHDCNLVLYDNSVAYDKNRPVWATNTDGRAQDCYLTMHSDGDLVIRDPYAKRVWASNTAGAIGNYVLVLRNDRNLVIYGGSAVWTSGSKVTSGKAKDSSISNDHDAETHNKTMIEELQKFGRGGISATASACNTCQRICGRQHF